MNSNIVIVDTGPLVALLNRWDRYHGWASTTLNQFKPPVFTSEAVLSEACFLLAGAPGGQDAVLGLVTNEVVKLDFKIAAELPPLRSLMRKFARVPMSLADACLVRMSELGPESVVITLNQNFHVYRGTRRQVIRTILPKPRA